MADTAFDPYAPPGSVADQWNAPPDQQVAQAPVLKDRQQPAPPAPAFDPLTTNIPAGQLWSQQPNAPALRTEPPPTTGVAPPVTGAQVAQPPKQVWGDEDDKRESKLADDDETKFFTDPNSVLSHRTWRPLVANDKNSAKQRIENHPMGKDFLALGQLIESGKMNKEEVRRYTAAQARMGKLINKDLSNEDNQVRAQNQTELRQIDAHYEDATKRDQTAATIGGHVDTKAKEIEAMANHRDPETARKAKWDYQVSPLSTMSKKATPDGKANYVALRDAVTSVAMLNKISNEKALDLTLAIGSPVGYDDKTGEWVRGANGKRGAGATFYQPLGTDLNGNAVIRIHNTTIRVPMETMQQLKTARQLGYNAAKKFRLDEEEAKKPGLVGRTLERGAKALGLQ